MVARSATSAVATIAVTLVLRRRLLRGMANSIPVALIGIILEPGEHRWLAGYLQGMGGGHLASAYDLETARAGERPLDEST